MNSATPGQTWWKSFPDVNLGWWHSHGVEWFTIVHGGLHLFILLGVWPIDLCSANHHSLVLLL